MSSRDLLADYWLALNLKYLRKSFDAQISWDENLKCLAMEASETRYFGNEILTFGNQVGSNEL